MLFESCRERLLRLADTAVHYMVVIERPDWLLGADPDKSTTRATSAASW